MQIIPPRRQKARCSPCLNDARLNAIPIGLFKDGRYTDHSLQDRGGTLASAAVPEFNLPLDVFFAR